MFGYETIKGYNTAMDTVQNNLYDTHKNGIIVTNLFDSIVWKHRRRLCHQLYIYILIWNFQQI